MFGYFATVWRSRRVFLSSLATGIAALFAGRESFGHAQALPARTVGIGRRVVTGFDAQGKSTIILDGPPPQRAMYNEPGKFHGYDAWVLRAVPSDLDDKSDPVIDGYEPIPPPKGGVVARITTFEPGYLFPLHETDTIDFGVVLSGRIELGLETGTTVLNAGDLIVQRGTIHSWRAVGGPSSVVFVLVDAKRGPR